MFPKIRRAAVLGAGVMGGVAHLTTGIMLMLDIVPPRHGQDRKKRLWKSPPSARFAAKGLEDQRAPRSCTP